MVWLFIVFVLTSSYTASLTCMLTVQRLEAKVTDIELLKRSNSMVGCYFHNFVCKYFEDVLHFNRKNIKIYNRNDFADELSSGNVSAVFDESPYAKIFLGKYCKGYTTTGLTCKFGGFGFVFPRGSLLVDDFSEAILTLSENGKLKELEDQLFSSFSKCASTNTNIDDGGSLGLDNFWGLFSITGGTSTIIVILFITHLIRKFRRQGNASLMDENIWKQMVTLARHFDKGKLHPPQEASTSSLEDKDDLCSVEDESEYHTPEHPMSSTMSIEEARETT